MSKNLGDYVEDYADLNTKFTTVDSTGLPTQLAGTPAISCYKSNSTTQSTAGITLTVDFDAVTGLNNVNVDLSADAFYETGEDYELVITTGTVDGNSVVGYVIAEFSIENRYARGTDSAATEAKQDIIDTNIDTLITRIVGTLAAGTHNAQSGDAYSRLGAPVGASVSADVAIIDGIVDTIVSRVIGTLASGTHNAQSGDGYAIVNNGTYGNNAIQVLIDALNNISAADVNSQVLDVMNVDTHAEPGQGAPGATISIFGKINYLYKAWRNKKVQDATTYELYDDAGTTVDQKAADSDDGTDATVGEIISGP